MKYLLFDGEAHSNLLPITFTRAVSDIRIGILTIKEKWEISLKTTVKTITQSYINSNNQEHDKDTLKIYILAAVMPNSTLVEAITSLKENECITYKGKTIVFCTKKPLDDKNVTYQALHFKEDLSVLNNTWDLFRINATEIIKDFDLLTLNRKSQPIPKTIHTIGDYPIFIEQGVQLTFSILNATDGPIYIGKNAIVLENCVIKGPFSLGEESLLKVGSKIYQGTSIGPRCKIGGEVNNAVIQAHSNKGHEGFLGNSFIGEWCNIGADSNTSNMKNNYGEVKVWTYKNEGYINSKLQFCGLIMGDHSKCGINTMFNTGTVVGVGAVIHGGNFPPKFVPDFSWGDTIGSFIVHNFEKAIDTAKRMKSRRNESISKQEIEVLRQVYKKTKKYRSVGI